jgi:putative heme iron utilization protein
MEAQALVKLVLDQRVASLGTLHDDRPFVSLVAYATADDLSAFFIHVSRLALHTNDLLRDPRVALMVAEPDRPSHNPLALARLSVSGEAEPLSADDPGHDEARSLYLARHPTAALNFQLGDFFLVRIRPASARFVAGFGRIYDLSAGDWAGLARNAS